MKDFDQADDRSGKWKQMLAAHGFAYGDDARTTSAQNVTRLELLPGRVSASVDDRERGSCDVTLQMPTWSDEQWSDVIEVLSRQALYAAQMLAGDFPDTLEPTLQAAGLSLLPGQDESIDSACTCCKDQGRQASCRHMDAVLAQAGERVADDPWLLFGLRGRMREQVLRALRRKRGQNGDGNGVATEIVRQDINGANGVPGVEETPDDARPLADDISSFWGSARALDEFRPHIVPPIAELVLLRRLGPPAFAHANEEVFDRLTDVYRRVTEAALALAFAEDPAPHLSEDDDVADLLGGDDMTDLPSVPPASY